MWDVSRFTASPYLKQESEVTKPTSLVVYMFLNACLSFKCWNIITTQEPPFSYSVSCNWLPLAARARKVRTNSAMKGVIAYLTGSESADWYKYQHGVSQAHKSVMTVVMLQSIFAVAFPSHAHFALYNMFLWHDVFYAVLRTCHEKHGDHMFGKKDTRREKRLWMRSTLLSK